MPMNTTKKATTRHVNRVREAATTGGAAASKPNPWYPDHAVFNATKEELKAMPEFKYAT